MTTCRKKRSRNHRYNKQSLVIFEDSAKPSSSSSQPRLKYEGRVCDVNIEGADQSQFKYVLLQVIAPSNGSKQQTEVNVIPVADMLYFRKACPSADKLLEEIDDDYDLKMRNDKLRLQHYKKIGKTLEEINKESKIEDEEGKLRRGKLPLLISFFMM